MTIKDENKDINMALIQTMEIRARDIIRDATRAKKVRIEAEGKAHDETMGNVQIIPYTRK